MGGILSTIASGTGALGGGHDPVGGGQRAARRGAGGFPQSRGLPGIPGPAAGVPAPVLRDPVLQRHGGCSPTPSGAVVSTIYSDRSVAQGWQYTSWSLVDGAGEPLARGTYSITIDAVDSDGRWSPRDGRGGAVRRRPSAAGGRHPWRAAHVGRRRPVGDPSPRPRRPERLLPCRRVPIGHGAARGRHLLRRPVVRRVYGAEPRAGVLPGA